MIHIEIRADIVNMLVGIRNIYSLHLVNVIIDAISLGDDACIYDAITGDDEDGNNAPVTVEEFHQVSEGYMLVKLFIYPYIRNYMEDDYYVEDIIEQHDRYFLMLCDSNGS